MEIAFILSCVAWFLNKMIKRLMDQIRFLQSFNLKKKSKVLIYSLQNKNQSVVFESGKLIYCIYCLLIFHTSCYNIFRFITVNLCKDILLLQLYQCYAWNIQNELNRMISLTISSNNVYGNLILELKIQRINILYKFLNVDTPNDLIQFKTQYSNGIKY